MSATSLPPSSGSRGRPVAVLLAAGSATWEPEAVAGLNDPARGVHLLQRCLDLADLLGTAATGTADVAVVGDRIGLDVDSVARLHRDGVRVVVVTGTVTAHGGPPPEAMQRLDVDLVLRTDDLPELAVRVRDVVTTAPAAGLEWPGGPADDDDPTHEGGDGHVAGRGGKVLAVWGAAGAPGRTTTAVALAAEAADRGHTTLLLDADPYGGSVAQHVAVLDEVSGLLGAARLANTGQLDLGRLAGLARSLDPGLRVLTGLPRPSRWPEVRPAAFEQVLALARRLDDLVVVDTGPGLDAGSDDPFDAAPSRDASTRTTLAEADAVVVVVAPDPVGLQRGARALTDLHDVRPTGADVVAVNRMRSSLGWDRRDVLDLLQRVAPTARLVVLPDDVPAADRALVSGRTLVASGDSGLRRAFADLAVEALTALGLTPAPAQRRARRRLGRAG